MRLGLLGGVTTPVVEMEVEGKREWEICLLIYESESGSFKL